MKNLVLIDLLNKIIQVQHGVQLQVAQQFSVPMNSQITIVVLHAKSITVYVANANIILE